MHPILYLNIAFLCIAHSVANCYNYTNKEPVGCGIKPKVHYDKTAARIINAKPPTKDYPWMAVIYKRGLLQPPDSGNYKTSASGGAIISKYAIITCGHCICAYKQPYVETKQPYVETCPGSKGIPHTDKDLNIKSLNEIYITVGRTRLDFGRTNKNDWEFDGNIEAYFYMYERGDYIISKNGDIGLVLKTDGLASNDGTAFKPICLPPPNTEYDKNGIIVKMAGWGRRYHQHKTKNIRDSTSCQTNEARILPITSRITIEKHVNSKLSYEERVTFLECDIPDTVNQEFCTRFLTDNNIQTLSANTELDADELETVEHLNSDEGYKRCKEYIKSGKKSWVRHMKISNKKHTRDQAELNAMFDKEIDRIIVNHPNNFIKQDICYNLKKVAKYGICPTQLPNPQHWGFCSRSCHVAFSGMSETDPYEEAEFKYFEEAPGTSNKFKGKLFG